MSTQKSESSIKVICRTIYENIEESPTVAAHAEKCYLSVSRFLHFFKEVTGKSYNEYIIFIRMERAKEMLCHTDMHISDIASALGYKDQNYFSRCFRKMEGTSPSEYRKDENNQ